MFFLSRYLALLPLVVQLLAAGLARAATQPLLSSLFESVPWEVQVPGSRLANRLPELNELLEENVKSDESSRFDRVIDEAENLLKTLRDNDKNPRRFKMYKRIKYTASQLEALVALREASQGCANRDYVDLAKFQRAIIDSGLETAQTTSLLSWLVGEAITRHGDRCRGNYLKLYEDREYELWLADDKRNLRLLLDRTFMNEFFSSDSSRDSSRSSPSITRQVDLLGSLKAQDVFARFRKSRLTLLQNSAKRVSHPPVLLLTDPDRCRSLLESTLVVPCWNFVDRTKDIFRPARMDLALDETKLNEITGGNRQFEDDWQLFRVCDVFVRNQRRAIHNICYASP